MIWTGRLLAVLAFALLGVGLATDDMAWSYAGLAVFALGAAVFFCLAWRMR